MHPLFNYYISYSSVSFSATKKSISLSLSNLLGASQSQVDVAADVLFAHDAFEMVALQDAFYFLVNTRENNGDALFLTHQAHVLEVVKTSGVDEGHLTHTDDANLWTTAVARHDVLKAVASTEEIRTVNLVNLYFLGNGEVLKVATLQIGILDGVYLVEDGMHIGNFCHAAHEEQTGTDETELNGDGEVEDDGKEECEQQYGDVALRIAQHSQERTPATHAIADNDEYTGQTGHRDILGERHEEQEDKHQYGSMDNACDRRTSAIVDVGHGAGYGTGGRNAAEEGRGNIGNALPD